MDGKGVPQGPTLVASHLAPGKRPVGRCISLLIYHQSGTRLVSLSDGQRLVVGRDATVEITLNDQGLSRRHASFEVVDGVVWVEDLGSTNGTHVNGVPIRRARLAVGDEATFGGAVASIHVLPPADGRQRGLESHDQFLTLLENEVARSRAFGRPFTLLMLRAERIGEHVEAIRAQLTPVDRLALYSEDILEILRPETSAEASRHLGAKLQSVLQEVDDATLAVGVTAYPDGGTSVDALLNTCREAVRRARPMQPAVLGGVEPRSWEEGPVQGLVVRSPAMQEVFETAERVARSLIPVLLIGDTGTGKEVLARLIHQSGPRKARRMAAINCGAIPATLVESVLFGHEKGAFTGATQSSKGLFEEADGGTVLLDEVGELSPSAQSALLRVLETKQLTRVGSSREVGVDVRVIAATNRDLEAMCREDRFRWDLYYRLNAMTIRIPPLRERPEEIGPLAELFVREASDANGRGVEGIDADAMRLLHAHGWPGNLRELRNAIERAVVITRSKRITVRDLPHAVSAAFRHAESERPAPGAVPGMPPLPGEEESLDYRGQMQREETRIILDALRRASWNRAQASQLLNLPVRTLSHKMKQLGIKRGLGSDEGD